MLENQARRPGAVDPDIIADNQGQFLLQGMTYVVCHTLILAKNGGFRPHLKMSFWGFAQEKSTSFLDL